jgi:hypothetical protein
VLKLGRGTPLYSPGRVDTNVFRALFLRLLKPFHTDTGVALQLP